MTTTQTKISVVIPNYNYADLLEKRVKSILAQTAEIAEIIFLDDASVDGSVQKIKKLAQKIKRIRPEIKIITAFNTKNSGSVCRQWKKGFELATGGLVWIAEVDDGAEKNFLEILASPLEQDEKIAISYADSKIVKPNGKTEPKRTLKRTLDKIRDNRWQKPFIHDGITEIKTAMCVFNTIPNVSAVLFRKKNLDLNFLDQATQFKIAGDWYFYEKTLLKNKIAYTPQKLNLYQIHDDSVTKTVKKEQYLAETQKMHEIILRDVAISNKMKAKMQAQEVYLARKWKIE